MNTFRQFLEVKNPPWEGLDYYANRAKDLRAIEEGLADFKENWDRAAKLIKDFIGSRTPWYDLDFYDVPYWLKNLAIGDLNASSFSHNATYSIRLQNTVDWLPKIKDDFYEQTRQLQSIIRPIEGTRQEFHAKYKNLFKHVQAIKRQLPEVLKTFEEQKDYFKGEKYEDEDYPTYEEGRKIVIKSVQDMEKLIKYSTILFDIKDKTEAWIERRNIAYQRQFSRNVSLPTHKPQEILYHATVAISAIQREGFKTKKETGVEGLGGGSSDLISFTSSYRLAKEIAIALKELVLVAKGQIKYEDIINWAKQNQIDINDLLHMTKMNAMSGEGPEDQAINLYRHYLHLAGEKNIRYNPVFWGSRAAAYKNINVNDVGVIAAIIDMDKVGEFLGAEEEYRIPPNAIIKIVRVFRV